MDARVRHVRDPQEESVGDLFGQLVEDGRTLARAEVNLYKQIAAYRASKARNGIIALVGAAVLGTSALTAIVVGLVLGIAELIGPVAAGFAVAIALCIAAYFLVRYGLPQVKAMSGDEEERQALRKGEMSA